jgi:hypothetical protein
LKIEYVYPVPDPPEAVIVILTRAGLKTFDIILGRRRIGSSFIVTKNVASTAGQPPPAAN